METKYVLDSMCIPKDSQNAIKFIVNKFIQEICPLMLRVRNTLESEEKDHFEFEISRMFDVYTLCCSQIKKSFLSLMEVYKLEYQEHIYLQESRQCALDRLAWCVNKLICIEDQIDKLDLKNSSPVLDESVLVQPLHFVNWIDKAFDELGNLAVIIYKTDNSDEWKSHVVDCLKDLHSYLDELLLSAMTLCKYCLPADQHVIKARCQVVIRESKLLLNELLEEQENEIYKATKDSLKLPIMPSNVNILIDVLNNVLYALETNTNTALLSLLVHCFSNHISPIDVLRNHFKSETRGCCSCLVKSTEDVTEDCSFIKDFDLYNERLMQIGSFAVSCSSDQNRIISLRSGLATLEALDPHLVPALMLSPDSAHASLLIDCWRQEVDDIKENIFLIVDPAAFAEKSKQTIHGKLLDLMRDNTYKGDLVLSVVDTGCLVYDFFKVYTQQEPDALNCHDKVNILLVDLNKAIRECKTVSNLLAPETSFKYDMKLPKKHKEATFDQLTKRLKLLYTLVSRINSVLHPKESEELFEEEEPISNKHLTHTLYGKNTNTYVDSPRKTTNIVSRSNFARTTNVRSKRIPLTMLTRNLKAKNDELSFSVELDKIFNFSESKEKDDCKKHTRIVNKNLDFVRVRSVLYNVSPMKRASLRKAVLNRHSNKISQEVPCIQVDGIVASEKKSLFEETSLQISSILNQMSSLIPAKTNTTQPTATNETYVQPTESGTSNNNILRLNINHADTTIAKYIQNLTVNDSTLEIPINNSQMSNLTQQSNVPTLERLKDLNVVETKLKNLRSLQKETNL